MDEIRKLSIEEMDQVAGGAYTDETRICSGCGRSFVVTAGEQEYYASRGITVSYCRECQAKNELDRKIPQSFDVICSGCGEHFKSPFKPGNGQEIYCSECISKGR